MKRQLALLTLFACVSAALAQQPAAPADGDAKADNSGSPAQIEARAKRMVANAKQLLENEEEDRAVSMLEAIPKMFPNSPSRFVAFLELGRHQLNKRQFDNAIGSLRKAFASEDREVQAEALLLQGQCQIDRGESGDAAMTLRKITQDYPTSAFANDAFFAIGQIHFDAGRWARAAEAYQMVGTAVPVDPVATNEAAPPVLTEAGQRVYVHVQDKDLAVLAALGESAQVELTSKSGDKEKSTLVSFGRGDGDFLASVLTTTDPSKPYDGNC